MESTHARATFQMKKQFKYMLKIKTEQMDNGNMRSRQPNEIQIMETERGEKMEEEQK